MSEPTRKAGEPPVVYVVTDLDPPAAAEQVDPFEALAALLRPLIGLAVVVVPVLATTALLFGLVLGWSPVVLVMAALLALPILISLTDLVGARLGWPPLAWTATRIAIRRRQLPGPRKEGPFDE